MIARAEIGPKIRRGTMMKLYYHPLSTYSQKVLLALYEKGIEVEREVVNMMNPQKVEEYRNIYPLGRIPFLQVTDDHVIPESSIIIEYLEGHHQSGTKLITDGVDASRQVRFIDRMMDQYLLDPIGTLFFSSMKPEEQRDHERLDKMRFYLDVTYQHLNERFGENTWIMGEQFTMADCAAIPGLFYAPNIYPYNDYPNIQKYVERAKDRQSHRQLMEEVKPALEAWENAQK